MSGVFLLEMNAVYKTDYKVRMSDADSSAKLKMPALLQMLQEAATEHAYELGIAYSHLKPMGLGWVIAKLIVNIDKIPSWDERIYIKTWPSTREKIVTYREFVATDANGNPLFSARSQWLLMDINARRIARLERLQHWDLFPEQANDDSFETPFEKIDATSTDNIKESIFSARNDDIDLNEHVNNAVFLTWAMESLPDEFAKRTPQKIKINFLDEVRPHTEVKARTQHWQDKTITSLVSPEMNREHARICIDWAK